jgi:hypothetical protein
MQAGPNGQTTAVGEGDANTSGAGAVAAKPWWRNLGVILALAALPRIGLGFAGLVAMMLLFTDQRRHPYTRLGGTLLIGWWTFLWARSGVPILFGLGLLGASAACFGVAAMQSQEPTARIRNAVIAALAALLAVLNVFPWGTRKAEFDKAAALTRAMQATQREVKPTHAQVTKTRERFVQRPLYLVLLFEPNEKTAQTGDGEPCFRRAEVHVVDALDGSVDRTDLVDRLMLVPGRYSVAQARERDGFCLPLPRGSGKDIVRIPGS